MYTQRGRWSATIAIMRLPCSVPQLPAWNEAHRKWPPLIRPPGSACQFPRYPRRSFLHRLRLPPWSRLRSFAATPASGSPSVRLHSTAQQLRKLNPPPLPGVPGRNSYNSRWLSVEHAPAREAAGFPQASKAHRRQPRTLPESIKHATAHMPPDARPPWDPPHRPAGRAR